MALDKGDTSYLGNPNLKKVGVEIQYTPEQIKEFMICATNPIYFIKTYCKIISLDEGLIPFGLRDYQEEMIDSFEDNRFVICKMGRQIGKSITVSAYLLWKALFHQTYNTAILANKADKARDILGSIQLMYEHLPLWLQQGVVVWNKGSIELENGSKIIAAATSSSAVRGSSFNLIYLDEFAFVPTHIQEEFFASVYPTISSGTKSKVIITSTPKGLNLFYKIWTDSVEGRNSYARVDIHWTRVPGRTEEWKQQTIANTSEDQFREEFDCEFLGSSNTLISGEKLKTMAYKMPIMKNDLGLKVYREPEPNTLYAIVADTSKGTGDDYSAFVVIDISKTPYQVVCTFRNNKISVLVFPNVIFDTAKMYNNALVLVETNDIGQQVADIIHNDLEYEGLLTCTYNGRDGQQISAGFGNALHNGVRTTKLVKRIGCSTLKTLVEGDHLLFEDFDIIYELSRFVAKGQSYEAEQGNDDLAMCLVIFGWFSTQKFFVDITNVDTRETVFQHNQEMLEENMLPFGIFANGMEDIHEEIIDDTQEKDRQSMSEEEMQLLMS